LKLIITTLAMLAAPCWLCLSAETQEQKPRPPAQQQQKQQQPRRMEIPADAVFYQDVSWSPDGRRIAFTMLKGEGGGRWSLYVMDADGARVERMPTPEGMDTFYTAWSPDGRRIAFGAKRNREEKADIYVIGADGTGLRRLTDDPAGDNTPAWSPDGRLIAFISEREGPHQIYVMGPDGSNQTRLSHDDSRLFNPQWSPDGRRIVYYAEKGDHLDQIWVMNSDGSEPKLLTGGVGHNIFPAFTRGGREIIFCSQRDGAEKSSVYTMKADGTELKKLAAAEGFYARPSPDGARVAFTTQGFPKNGIYVVGADGSGLKRLTP
jgi:Tol biopolymer transport system component